MVAKSVLQSVKFLFFMRVFYLEFYNLMSDIELRFCLEH
jgi:hypothetical protein